MVRSRTIGRSFGPKEDLFKTNLHKITVVLRLNLRDPRLASSLLKVGFMGNTHGACVGQPKPTHARNGNDCLCERTLDYTQDRAA